MCLTALREGDVTDKPFLSLLRSEFDGALRNGLLAASIVLVVTLSWGASTTAVLLRTTGALVLGVALYLVVLLAGAMMLRLGSTSNIRTPKST